MCETTVTTPEQFTAAIQQAADSAAEKIRNDLRELFPEIMMISQIAEYLKVSEATVHNRINDKGLPVSYKLSDPRFIKSEVDAWLKT